MVIDVIEVVFDPVISTLFGVSDVTLYLKLPYVNSSSTTASDSSEIAVSSTTEKNIMTKQMIVMNCAFLTTVLKDFIKDHDMYPTSLI